MNCKPGDLAIIVSAKHANEIVGKIVRCVELTEFHGVPCWKIEPHLPNAHGGLDYWAVADERLRPIRNPGDDEADLMLAPLPTTPEKVPA